MNGSIGLILIVFIGICYSHTIFKRSYPTPKGTTHGKSKDYLEYVRANVTMKAKFQEMYGKMVTNGKTTGYLSVDGVPYHSVEELMVEGIIFVYIYYVYMEMCTRNFINIIIIIYIAVCYVLCFVVEINELIYCVNILLA